MFAISKTINASTITKNMNLNKKDTYDSDIQKIRANYQKIKSYQSNLLTDPDFLSCKISQDSEIFLYKTKSGDSKILTIKQSIKNGVFYSEYYYNDNHELFFVFTKTKFFLTSDGTLKTKIEENRYYFKNEKMFEWINHNRLKIPPISPVFQNQAKRILGIQRAVFDQC